MRSEDCKIIPTTTKGQDVEKSKCCGGEIKIKQVGEFAVDPARMWAEIECQQCGGIDFEDEN